MPKEPSTPGDRLFLIRLSYGDGVRKAESLDQFAARVEKRTGERYDPATISLLERNKQKWRLEDAEIFSQLDKEGRGAAWLAFGPIVEDEPAKRRKANG